MIAADAPPAERALLWTVAAAATLAVVAFVWLCSQRLPYPFELEWMEGAMVDHADRVRHGLDVYTAPSPDHVAFLYTPLLYYLGALLWPLVGSGFLALRLCSALFALASALLLWRLSRRVGARPVLGLAAAGLFLCGEGYVRSWYDLARNDTTFLCFVLWTALLLYRGGWRAAALAGVTATLAFLGKQTALLWLPAFGVGALLLDWRKGLVFGGSAALGIGTTVLCYHFATDHWFTFFVFEMPRGHGIQPDRKLGFFTEDLVPMLPMLVGTIWLLLAQWRAGARREAGFCAAFAGGGLLTSYLSRLHNGGYENVVMYGFAAGCALLPCLPAVLPAGRQRLLALALVLLQFACLVVDPRSLYQPGRPTLLYDPSALLPTAAHRQASTELVEFLRRQPGDVLVPFHGRVAGLAGKPAGLHAQALNDLMQRFAADQNNHTGSPMSARAFEALRHDLLRDLQARRWSVIVLDGERGRLFEQVLEAACPGAYRRRPGSPITDPTALRPTVGMDTDAPYVLEPVR